MDENGGLIEAIAKAKELAGFKPEDRLGIRLKLQEASPLDLISRAMTSSSMSAERRTPHRRPSPRSSATSAAQAVLGQIRQTRRQARRPGLDPAGGGALRRNAHGPRKLALLGAMGKRQ